MKIWTRRQGETTINPGQYLIKDVLGNNLEVTSRISSGAMVTTLKMQSNGSFERFIF